MTFASLHLMPQLLQAVTKSGYASPTPIQAATIPLVLAGKDVLGCAQTGTGKTAAFALPILQNLSRRPVRPGAPRPIRALILTPTRELAQQIQDNFVAYGKQLALFSCVLFGGVNQNAQVEALHRGADIVVACPGRLMDLMNQGYVRLDYVETFVLDEADRMLDMGFIHDVRRIAAKLPAQASNPAVLRHHAPRGGDPGHAAAPRPGNGEGGPGFLPGGGHRADPVLRGQGQ